jgi:hypothetical protein
MRSKLISGVLSACIACAVFAVEAQAATGKEKVKAKIAEIKKWAAEAVVIETVKSFNAGKPTELKEMSQEKWQKVSVIDPIIKNLRKNKAGEYFKSKQDDSVAEVFLNGADGSKAALLSKTTSWSHKGKPKHDQPMTGKEWIGEEEVDESTGVRLIQVAVPVLDAGKPIGSLVVGFNVAKI